MILLFSYGWWPISHWSPEWVGAIASFLAVATALFLPYWNDRTRINVSAGNLEQKEHKKEIGIFIEIYNKGKTPVLLK